MAGQNQEIWPPSSIKKLSQLRNVINNTEKHVNIVRQQCSFLWMDNGTIPELIPPSLYIQNLHSAHAFKYPPSCFNLLATPFKM